jgi:AbrB family looped-hinge helix DNA binding protein
MSQARAQKEQVTAELPTKSAKIRALHDAGYSRTEIADFLGIRYQHVRNVLVNDARVKGTNGPASQSGASGGGAVVMRVRIGAEGRVLIPAAFREKLGLKESDTLLASMEEGGIRLLTIPAAVRHAQALIRHHVPEGISLVDELLADRRREAEHEASNG